MPGGVNRRTPTVPDQGSYDNAFKVQWELFLRHVVKGDPFPWNLLQGAKGVQLAELGLKSWAERRWVWSPAQRSSVPPAWEPASSPGWLNWWHPPRRADIGPPASQPPGPAG